VLIFEILFNEKLLVSHKFQYMNMLYEVSLVRVNYFCYQSNFLWL